MNAPDSPTPARRSIDLPAALLWASAFVLIGLIVVQAGKAAAHGRARDAAMAEAAAMDLVARVGDFTALTINSGSDDVLIVLDSRGEDLYTYRVTNNQRQFEFLSREDLKTVFATARRIGSGTGRR